MHGLRVSRLYSEIKRKDIQHNNLYKTMWRTLRRNAVQSPFLIWLWYTDVSTSVSCWFRKRNIICNKQKCHLLFFRIREISGGENLLWKPSRPWRFRGIHEHIYHVVIYSSWLCASLSNVLSARTMSSVSVRNLYIYTDWLRNFVFLMQINSYEYQWKGNNWVQSVCFQSGSLQIYSSSIYFRRIQV